MTPNTHPELHWLAENSTDVYRRYPGRWIALRQDQVIAVGDTATEVDQKARQSAPDGNFVLMAVEEDLDTVNGLL